MDSAEAESAVYLSKDASLTTSSELFKLNAASGEWEKVSTVVVEDYVLVASQSGPHNGYYVYKHA